MKSVKTKPIVWSISGADCSGGAGIAADIKTGHALNVEVCHLITANTVQNAHKLVSVNPVEIGILRQQAQALLEDKVPNVIKIGLIASRAQITWLTALLTELKQQYPLLKVVFDPVGSASVGGKFNDFELAALTNVWPLIDVATPNLSEAQAICSKDTETAEQLAKLVCDKGAKACVVKGGHSKENQNTGLSKGTDTSQGTAVSKDITYQADSAMTYRVSSSRVETSYSHGGGCSFASAIASFIAHGYLLRDALTLTKAFIQRGLTTQQGKSDYYGAFEQTGWPELPEFFPHVEAEINQKYCSLPAFAPINSARGEQGLGLYPVVDSIEWLEKLLPLGVEIIQLRVKNQTDDVLDDMIGQAVALGKKFNARLFINDYWQLAIKHGAYGVHIGQEDLLDADLEAIQASGLRLGISTHGCYEFLLAQQLTPSYLAVGAIFPTNTKDMTGQIQGVDNLAHLLKLTTDIPVVAIGGINHERAQQVWATGVDSIAVVTAITKADDYQSSVQQFKDIFKPIRN